MYNRLSGVFNMVLIDKRLVSVHVLIATMSKLFASRIKLRKHVIFGGKKMLLAKNKVGMSAVK